MANFVNPFTKMRHWLMYEELEIEGVLETFSQRKTLLKVLNKTIEQINSDAEELIKLERGDWTLSTLLMNKQERSDKAKRMVNE